MKVLDECGRSVGEAKIEGMVKLLQQPGSVGLLIPNMPPSKRFLLTAYLEELLYTDQPYLLIYTPCEGEESA